MIRFSINKFTKVFNKNGTYCKDISQYNIFLIPM